MKNELSVQEQRVLTACRKASSKNPVSRHTLKEITKLQDSDNRDLIGRLRDKGYRILFGNGGYYYARSEKQYKEWIDKYTKYAKTILARANAMDNHVEGQVSIDEQV